MINIIIIANKPKLSEMEQYLQAENDINVLCTGESIAAVEKFINKAQLIVLDTDEESAQSIISALNNIPVISVVDSATKGFIMLEYGAAEMHIKNHSQTAQYSCKLLASKIRIVSKKGKERSVRKLKRADSGGNTAVDKLIAIGSSTGGTNTVEFILKQFPDDMPPILLVQHMPPVFTRMFAERLHNTCRLNVWEAKEGDALMKGLVLVAPGDRHMVLAKNSEGLYVKCTDGEPVCNQRPSVDVLFKSVANVLGNESHRAIGIILTGMGSDGAKGLLAMRNMGAYTIGQDESSSVVYGMPKAAYECGAVQTQLHLNDIPSAIINFAKK